ncbi:hypothetical protein BJV74DRAFT_284696 [Russula compacta]|nr:hypothetical protein BJV74DRAFT_284696 [Russula compacta]
MSLSSFSSLSSYSSESDLSTVFHLNPFKSSSRARRRSPGPSRSKDKRPSSSRHTRRKRSITPTRTPASSRYDDGAIVPYSFHSPGSKSGISYSDIDRWRATTAGGSDFTYSSESSITPSSVTTSSVVSSARTRSSRIVSSSRRSTASSSKQLKAPSVASQHPHPEIHHSPSRICEHCHRPPHQIHGRTDVLPALRLEPHSAFLAAYRLSRLSCPDALERATTLDPDDPFIVLSGLSERPSIPPHLLPELAASERRARRLSLLLDSDDPDIRDWAQAEYLKLGRTRRRLVREGVFEVKVALDGAEEPLAEDWSANEREEDLEKLRERLGREKERREEHEEVEREMVWAREMFAKWFIDGRVDGVFRLAASVLNEFLKEVARDEGEEWVTEEAVEAEGAEEQPPISPKSTQSHAVLRPLWVPPPRRLALSKSLQSAQRRLPRGLPPNVVASNVRNQHRRWNVSLGQSQNLSERQHSRLKRIPKPKPKRKKSERLTTPLRRSLMLNLVPSSRPCQSLCPCQSFTRRYSQRRVSSTMP